MNKIAQFISMEFSLFWNGKISLPWMYWFWGVLVGNLISQGTLFLALKLQLEPFALHYYLLPYAAFWTVGTWRSANNYKGPRFLAFLTELLVIFPIIILVWLVIRWILFN